MSSGFHRAMAHPQSAVVPPEWFSKSVIPVIWRPTEDVGLLHTASMIFLQGCELSQLMDVVGWLRQEQLAHLPVMLHIDLLGGLTSDDAGLRYLAGLDAVDGIITVRPHLVTAARRLGLASILLLFLQDGRAVDRGLHVIEQSKPDAIELVPGVAALDLEPRFQRLGVPRIAGGLIRTPDLVHRLLAAGFDAVSSSDEGLWSMNQRSSRSKARQP